MSATSHFMKLSICAALLLSALPGTAATLSIKSPEPGSFTIHPAQDSAYYFLLQQTTDLLVTTPSDS